MSFATEVDQLSELEARVAKAVETVARLRAERDAARKEASDAKAALEKAQHERHAVRGRIEKLLGQIDLVSSES